VKFTEEVQDKRQSKASSAEAARAVISAQRGSGRAPVLPAKTASERESRRAQTRRGNQQGTTRQQKITVFVHTATTVI
jgi:hypothetical protein